MTVNVFSPRFSQAIASATCFFIKPDNVYNPENLLTRGNILKFLTSLVFLLGENWKILEQKIVNIDKMAVVFE